MNEYKKSTIFKILFLISIAAAGVLYFTVPEQHERYEHALWVLKQAKEFLLG